MEYFTNVNVIVEETEYLLPIKYFGIPPPPPEENDNHVSQFFKY